MSERIQVYKSTDSPLYFVTREPTERQREIMEKEHSPLIEIISSEIEDYDAFLERLSSDKYRDKGFRAGDHKVTLEEAGITYFILAPGNTLDSILDDEFNYSERFGKPPRTIRTL